jgi:hypothetical protein
MKQSAVQWLVEKVLQTNHLKAIFEDEINQAKEMENQQQGYSDEEIKSAFKIGFSIGYGSDVHAIDERNRTCEEWFEQFKNK